MKTNHTSNDFSHFMNRISIAPVKRGQRTVWFPFFMWNYKMWGSHRKVYCLTTVPITLAWVADWSIDAIALQVRVVSHSTSWSCLFSHKIFSTQQIIKIIWMERSWRCGGSEQLTVYRPDFWKMWNSVVWAENHSLFTLTNKSISILENMSVLRGNGC